YNIPSKSPQSLWFVTLRLDIADPEDVAIQETAASIVWIPSFIRKCVVHAMMSHPSQKVSLHGKSSCQR
ncbi:MAG TPA: hypothetical protein VE954_24030, partial [Oligoflexus sp.]